MLKAAILLLLLFRYIYSIKARKQYNNGWYFHHTLTPPTGWGEREHMQ